MKNKKQKKLKIDKLLRLQQCLYNLTLGRVESLADGSLNGQLDAAQITNERHIAGHHLLQLHFKLLKVMKRNN